MNFVANEKLLKKLLISKGKTGYAGNYVYQRDELDKTVKIGMSEAGLFRRLKSAKSCYPYTTEFWVKYLIISIDGHREEGVKSTTRHIETELLTQSKKSSTVSITPATTKEEGKRAREYRIIGSELNLEKLIQSTLNLHRDKWDYLICFSDKGWKIIVNDRLVKKPITSAKMLQYAGEDQPLISDLEKEKGMVIIPEGVRVGQVIKGDHWKPFTVLRIISKKHLVGRFKGDKHESDIIY